MGAESSRPNDLDRYAKALIRTKARKLSALSGFTASDREDVEQELALHLIKQSHLYDPSRASWRTFATRVVETAAAMFLRDRRRQKRAAGYFTESLDQAVGDREGGPSPLRDSLSEADLGRRTGTLPADESVEQRERTDAVRRALASLPPDLQAFCVLLADGTEAGIARELGISRRQVRNALERIRRRFETAGLADS